MDTKHTPGPWHVNGYAYSRDDASRAGRRVFICSPESDLCEGYTINGASVEVCHIRTARRPDDARLIAAAPDLLDVCQRALHYLNEPDAFGDLEEMAFRIDAEAAIEAATGQPIETT